ncbi:MAG: hypothetical protein Q9195_008949 [Heterodermia aff. obscurata]
MIPQVKELEKRTMEVLECDSGIPVPKALPGDLRVNAFTTCKHSPRILSLHFREVLTIFLCSRTTIFADNLCLTANTHENNIVTSLCGEYPQGLGYECSEAGQLHVIHPFTTLYTSHPDSEYLRELCGENCYCPDIAPDVPEQLTPERARQCVANGAENADGTHEAAPAECTGTNYRDPRSPYYVLCSRIYGFPKETDCISAYRQMGRRVGHLIDDREFIGDGFAPAYDNYTQERTPQFFASRDCNISVDTRLASAKSGPRSDLEMGNYLWGRAYAIRKKCVEPLGMGGWAVAGKPRRI